MKTEKLLHEVSEQAVQMRAGSAVLSADLRIPDGARGLVAFAHGSGSGRKSSRNRAVAASLNQAGFATLLLDLLSAREEEVDSMTAEFRFNIPLLAERMVEAVDWAKGSPQLRSLPIGLFGASTGAAAALVAAALRPEAIGAVVSRGGRPDLAGEHLAAVKAPVLLIVGGNDAPVIELNERAMEELRGVKDLVIVPRATHLFPEPGALEMVSRLAGDWFGKWLGGEGER